MMIHDRYLFTQPSHLYNLSKDISISGHFPPQHSAFPLYPNKYSIAGFHLDNVVKRWNEEDNNKIHFILNKINYNTS